LSIVTQLRYPDRAYPGEGLAPLLDRATDEEHWKSVASSFLSSGSRVGHRYLHALLLFWFNQRKSYRDEFVEWAGGAQAWIEGQDEASSEFLTQWVGRQGLPRQWFPALPDHRTRSHTYTYLLTGISELARRVGYSGLVVLLDEAEYHERLGGEDRSFGDDFFARLLYAALRPAAGQLAAWEHNSYRGGHRQTKDEPTIFQFPSGLVPVIAGTPETRVARLLESFLIEDQVIHIPSLGSADVHQLILKLANLYWSGYGPGSGNGDWPPTVSKETFRGAVCSLEQWAEDWMKYGAEDVVRPVIRTTIHILDLLRHGRIRAPKNGRELAAFLEDPSASILGD
ncbi:MAG: hypothetical protein KJ927_14090, partial [Candidatus Eisenbacteria bacterium]|nr:hypothetical protein [Candidatus Eisenbacteria bacterium]